MPRLSEKYNKQVVPSMMAKFGYPNVMAVPKIKKVVVNIGTGRVGKEPKFRDRIEKDIGLITGQKPSPRIARKSISGFKVRQGDTVGFISTLRGKRMYDFLDRLISIALPRSRDFRGIETKSFDQNGNLNIGLREQIIFPEVVYESSKDIFPFQITVTTTAKTKEEGKELLKLMGFPVK
ncbi:MAG: large subunit ribosomal protein L5 [Parcubacteria group bacterium Gr01-1014_2]|nr:MAG: large subunit ribosomal protein L5 [Parcubacteria group bacterium Gr01-1014_2]